MKQNSIYQAPVSDVEVREPLPDAFMHGPLSASKLRFAALLSVLYFLMLFPITGFSFMAGWELNTSGNFELWADGLTVLAMVVWVYLMLVFKSLLNLRLEYTGADTYILIILALSILLTVLTVISDAKDYLFSPLNIATFIGMIPLGIVSILFGRRLLKISSRYRYLPLYAWTTIIIGICTATIILLMLAFPLNLISAVAMAMMFFNASKELTGVR